VKKSKNQLLKYIIYYCNSTGIIFKNQPVIEYIYENFIIFKNFSVIYDINKDRLYDTNGTEFSMVEIKHRQSYDGYYVSGNLKKINIEKIKNKIIKK
jgi:hypothetical protein